jgi:hypothetical protein
MAWSFLPGLGAVHRAKNKKFEARNPKLETISNNQRQRNTKFQTNSVWSGSLVFWIFGLFRISSFEFRIFDSGLLSGLARY